jgi:hypothetical protein
MQNTPSSHLPFEQLPLEARALFFIYASAALARYQSHRPRPSELANMLATVWDTYRLTSEDLSDPTGMTRLLEKNLVPLPSQSCDEALEKGAQ